ncbi:MAG: T9SS type A sorting domain-containing protein, partial [candidate division Zixibacteria bacterium]|nr:T9SS type A sorting domain-containing protein [candidate division Zixibacteria bacterium]
EMAYDDGALENAYYYYDAANLMATMFVPESYPVSIDSVMIHVLTEGDPYWPWPDANHDPIGVSIYIDDGTGMPQPDPVFYTEATAELGQWIRVNVNEIVVTTGNFWVCMSALTDFGPYDGLGLDLMTDYPANKWTREYDVWGPMDTYTGDHMIRAKVFGGGASSWVGYDDAMPAGAISSEATPRGNSELVAGTGRAHKTEPATMMPSTPNYMAYHPHILGERPLITDTEVLAGYNLYRDTSPAPFDRDLMINDELITATMYDDWGDDPYGPIENSVLYYYQASAVYDIGEGNFVEVGPSNEATGMAENHPPEAPVNLVGDVDDHTVNLSWDPNTDYDIAGYNVYRRDYNQSDFNLVGSVEHPTTAYSEVLTIDGIYRYKITAVDAEDMESEGFSNYIDMGIGLIPPGMLRATDDKEFKIDLSWRNPGGAISDVQDLNIGVVMADYPDAQSEVVDFLINSGEVSSATVIDAQNSTPVFGDLEPFDMLIVWTNYQPQDPIGLGDALAEYAETGQGVLALEFSFTQNWGVSGRFITEYSPFGSAVTGYMDVNLGEYDESHPLMDGVTILSDYYVFDVPLQNNAEAVATWDNGWPAVAINADNPNVVCINGYVGSPDHQHGGDMLQLVLNSVIYVGSGSGIEPDGFTLYKADNESGPFVELGSFPGDQHDFDDYPVPNGVEYWYMVTAIWDGEESDPSNVAMGIAMNYPPEPPYDLTAEAVGQNVNLDWVFDDLMGDFDHYNIYRRLMPDGEWEIIGDCEPSEYVDVIEEGNDGMYGYRVTAVDTGDPELESNTSNTAYALVGHVPPTSLAAESRHESQVPLRWNLPGTWTTGPDDRRDRFENPVISSNYRVLNDGSDLDMSYKGIEGPIYPPVILDEGGPDEFGYTWIDSDESGGPTYEWRDITGIGEQIPITGDDQNLGPFELGFDFSFYGNIFTTFNICGNGWLSFTSVDATYWNQPLPSPDAMENLVAPFWDDLYPPNGGEFWYYSDGSECVVSYINVPHIGSGGPYTFQVIFRSTGTIVFQYDVMNPETNSATVGIQNADGTIGLQVAFDQEYIHDQLAVRLGTSPDGIAPAHYNLYRSETSPVPVDVDHLITSDIDGELTSFIDEDGLVNGTTYYYVMTATWPDSVDSPASNEAFATPLLGGRLAADPMEIEANNDESEIVIVPLTLTNDGGIPVMFDIAPQSEALTFDESQRPETPEFTRHVGDYDKTNIPPEPVYPPVITDQGGPDEFGYVWIDSDETNGPHFDWIDITGIGIPLFMSDDDNQGPFPMEFAFPFYDQVFWDFRICSNGFISFTSMNTSFSNTPIPDPYAPENLVAPFWDDMNPNDGGSIFYYTSAESTIVSWIDMPHFSVGGPYTYQIILTSNGVITFQYDTMYDPLDNATIGIQNATNDIALQVAYNQPYVHDGLAIRINAGWLSVDPAQGEISAGSSFEVDVIMDASLLEDGVHDGLLTITAWDENVDVPSIEIPVEFWVDHVGIVGNEILLPQEFALNQNYPNPFNAQTEIRYALPIDSDIRLEVYNILGQKVAGLVDGKKEAGYHTFIWDGTSASGDVVASGMYLYKLVTNEKTFVRKMLMLK